MSSILDALKKLEEERAEAKLPTDDESGEDAAERELLGRSVLRERLTIRLTPLTLVLGGLGLTGLFVAISVVVTMTLIPRQVSNEPPIAVSSLTTSAPGPAPSPEVALVAPAEPLEPAPAPDPSPAPAVPTQSPLPDVESERTEAEIAPEPETEPEAVEPKDQPEDAGESAGASEKPVEEAPADVRAEQPVLAETPPPERVETARAEQVVETPSRQEPAPPRPTPPAAPEPPQPAATFPPPDLDMAALALRPLRETDRHRLGLTGLQINMLQPANKNRPYDSAIINLNRVDLGELIPRTNARLIALDGLEGIVIEIEATHERFYVRF